MLAKARFKLRPLTMQHNFFFRASFNGRFVWVLDRATIFEALFSQSFFFDFFQNQFQLKSDLNSIKIRKDKKK